MARIWGTAGHGPAPHEGACGEVLTLAWGKQLRTARTEKGGCLSSVEACAAALSMVEWRRPGTLGLAVIIRHVVAIPALVSWLSASMELFLGPPGS